MRVEQLMTKQVKSCGPGDTLHYAAQLMWDNDCGCLPVCAGDGVNRLVGVITDRDICMSALFEGRSLSELSVSSAMARPVQTCRASDLLSDADRTMREARIRRLPVVDAQGGLIGLLSLADLAHEAAREQNSPRKELTGNEVSTTLASICEPPVRRLAA
jgi:CBS-domain-containing membrane protein